MYFVRPPYLLKRLYKGAIWRVKQSEKIIYLTFDDGPVPEVTSAVLAILKTYQINATFFCVGENIGRYPSLFTEILEKHKVGNHTFNHLNAWKTSNYTYYKNIKKFDTVYQSSLFRPPYGRITRTQTRHISKKYKIIMWDVLSYDYSKNTSPKKCLSNVMKNVKNGSIIVFHDNKKAVKNLIYALPRSIEQLLHKGFTFDVIDL